MHVANGEILGGKPAITTLIDRTFNDAGANQWIRELVMNGYDAKADTILLTAVRPDIAGWDSPGMKVAVVDDGVGMSEEDGRVYMGDIFNGKSSLDTNFHVGARVATLPISPAGVIVASWDGSDPDGWMIWLKKDDDSGLYICQYFSEEEYGVDEADWDRDITAPAFPWLKHRLIDAAGRGTVVVLMGDSVEANTYGMIEVDAHTGKVKYPTELPTKALFSSYLSTTFWNSPCTGTSMRVAYGGAGNMADHPLPKGEYLPSSGETPAVPFGDLLTSDAPFTSIDGAQRSMRYKYVEDSGVVSVIDDGTPTANIHYFLIREKGEGSRGKNAAVEDLKQYASFPLFGELYAGELYAKAPRGSAVRSKMERYGIFEASVRSRTVLIVEPLSQAVTPNTGRGALTLPGAGDQGLPHDEWGYLFRKNMPQSLRDALEEARVEDTVVNATLNKATAEIDEMVSHRLGCYIKDKRAKRQELVSVDDMDGDAAAAPHPPGGARTGEGRAQGTSNTPRTDTGRTIVVAPARKGKRSFQSPAVSFTSWHSTADEPDLGTRMVRVEPYGDSFLIHINRAHPFYASMVEEMAQGKKDDVKFKTKMEETIIKEVHALTASALSMRRSSKIGSWSSKLSVMADERYEAVLSNLILSPYHMEVRARSIRV